MLGSSASVSDPNTFLNTAVAEVLKQFADKLETAIDFKTELHELIKRVITDHKRIVFNGNGYDDKWIEEAKKRGLLNLKTTPDALPAFIEPKNVALFTSHKVYTEKEMHSRYEIRLQNYCKLIHIEAQTMLDMAKTEILPAVSKYCNRLSDTVLAKKSVSSAIDYTYEFATLEHASRLQANVFDGVHRLEQALQSAAPIRDVTERSVYYKDKILTEMQTIRKNADDLERIVAAEYWPFPVYGDLLFGI